MDCDLADWMLHNQAKRDRHKDDVLYIIPGTCGRLPIA
jgi:hypothetical protein